MIGLVIVSHSRKLSDGLKEMADGMSQSPVPIMSAGGMDDPEDALGTDALRILGAIKDVMSQDGVLVFSDIGSAQLNAETAIDLLEEPQRNLVQLCDAPLVEGVLAAAIQIASGSPLETVIAEAQGGFAAPTVVSQPITGKSQEFTIRNHLGLHARPAAVFVEAMSAFDSEIRLTNLSKQKPTANAKSINGVMLSEVSRDNTIRIDVDGAEAEAVFEKVGKLIAENFGEVGPAPVAMTEAKPKVATKPTDGQLKGISIAPGFALGSVHHINRTLPDIKPEKISDTDAELVRLETALSNAENEIRQSVTTKGDRLSAYDRKIFDAHIAYLHDHDILDRVSAEIISEQVSASAIWCRTMRGLSQTYAALEDPLLKARASDVIDVGLRVLRFLTGDQDNALRTDNPVVFVFDELRPSDVLMLDLENALGICAASGGITSHAGILASTLPIPVIFAAGPALAEVDEGALLLLDGSTASITIAPDQDAISKMHTRREKWAEHRKRTEAARHLKPETTDGHTVRVGANMASVDELSLITGCGADEVGLLRTEFLFMKRDAAPSEEDQYQTYRTIIEGLKGRPLTIRTMDIGGDKPVSYIDRPPEANPNLGWRGLRYSLDAPELFEPQIAAILRASAHGPVRLMFPLVSTLDELLAAKRHVDIAMEHLAQRAEPFDKAIEIGAMIEVPAAVETANLLAKEVDFFSIGTNDLTQYVMASDRANPKVQSLFDPFNPAVLKMIDKAIKAANEAGIWIGMCGAMAGNPAAVPILLGLGLDEFSMTPRDIAEFKYTLRNLSRKDCVTLAEEVLTLPSAAKIRERVANT